MLKRNWQVTAYAAMIILIALLLAAKAPADTRTVCVNGVCVQVAYADPPKAV